MSLLLTATTTAIAAGLTSSFLATGGVEPYVYSVLPDGAGGSIDPDTGIYQAPQILSFEPKKAFDTVVVTDANAATTQLKILVGTPIQLFCDIIQTELGLAPGRVYLWDQKINEPKDSGLYVAVAIMTCKPFGNVTATEGDEDGLNANQSVNMQATVAIDLISRGTEARDRKEEIIFALNSIYAQQQQELNSFYIGKLSPRFVNLSPVDGAAIPYRFSITVNMQYFVKRVKPVPYFDDFTKDIITES